MDVECVYRIEERGGIKCLKFLKLEKMRFLRCYFTTKVGGVSKGPFSSLNLSFSCGDDAEDVRKNISLFLKNFSLNFSFFVIPRQIHGKECRIIERETLSAAPLMSLGERLPYYIPMLNTDALITKIPKVALTIYVADCICAFFVEEKAKIIAVAHLGWRAILNGIIKNIFEKMESIGAKRENISAFLSPAIGPCCYTIGEELWKELGEKGIKGLEKELRLDLWSAFEGILEEEGIKNITSCRLCTFCKKDLFFSYRRDKETGRMMGIIYIEE